MRIGEALDRLGVEAELDDTYLIASAVVILSVYPADDSRPTLVICTSENLSWIEQAGMLTLAGRIHDIEAMRED